MQELVSEVKELRVKVAALDKRADGLKRRKLVGGSLVPDPNFSPSNYDGDLRKCLEAIGAMVKNNEAQPWPKVSTLHSGNVGSINAAVTVATMQQVGRSVGSYLWNLELPGRALGSNWHITENRRLYDQFVKCMVQDSATIWGVTINMLRPRSNWKGGEAFDSGPNGITTVRNDKEFNLVTGTLGDMVYRFFETDDKRAEASLDVVLRFELVQALWGGGDILGFTDRVLHPFVKILNYLWQQGQIARKSPAVYERVAAKLHAEMGSKIKTIFPAKAADRVKQCEAKVAKMIVWLEDEMGPVTQAINGKELDSWTWAFNVLGITPEKLRNQNSKGEYEDGYQPLVYVKFDQTLLMQTGIYGLGMFAEESTQRRLSNTQYAGVQPAPLQHRTTDSPEWVESLGWNSHAPIAKRVVDGYKNPKEVTRYSFPAKNGGHIRTLVARAVSKDSEGERYFEAKKTIWGDEVGGALMYGTPEMLAYSQKEWGTPSNIQSKGQDVGWVCGMALRLQREAGLLSWT